MDKWDKTYEYELPKMKKTVSLVLGSGGARGLAHIGIIKWLEDNDYEIKSISGCSMGALVGGFYAAGKLDKYVEWLESLDTLGMLKLLDFKGSGGLVSGDKLIAKLTEIIGDYKIEELDVKFTAVATNIELEKEVWINSGSLMSAIRASISLPLFFTPYKHNKNVLVDGGVLNPVPIAPTMGDDTELTISVNLGGEVCPDSVVKRENKKDKKITTKIKEYMEKVSLPDTFTKEDGMYIVANKSIETMQGTIARMKLAAYPPDIEINIPRNICGTFDFTLSKELIEYGYKKCEESFLEQES